MWPLHAAVFALLDGIANLNAFDGEVPTTPPLDPDGRVHPYAVLYAGPGRASSQTVCATPRDMDVSFQVTAVGGDTSRCLWAVDRIRGTLTGMRLTVDGLEVGQIVETTDPGPARRDDDVQPSRMFVPILYSLTATN